MSLLELVVVLAVLAALAGILVPMAGRGVHVPSGQGNWTAEETVTRANLVALRHAILGANPDSPGYRADVGRMPRVVADLLRRPAGVAEFDPARATGWRGPYLHIAGARYGGLATAAAGFTAEYGAEDDPVVADAWGNPIVIQQAATGYARLVSAGPDGVLDTLNDADGTGRGDDLLLFLLREDPAP